MESVERFESKRLSNTEKKVKPRKKGKKYFPPKSRFNPNDYSLDDWMALGLSVKQSQSILNFVQRGIYSNSALEKIYVMPTEVYDLIKDSTYYEKQITEFTVIKDSEVKPIPLLEINSASKEDLIELNGVGEFYAKQILKYKNELGGFVFIEQLLEVWKMRLETYEKLLPQLIIDTNKIKKINVNTCSLEDLRSHPYLDYYQANSIIKMRMQKDGYNELQEILESKLINEEEFQRLLPYLSL
ncbi:MAG: ComEA family DNA-binding protein [Crocinitomicaceae bacterium]